MALRHCVLALIFVSLCGCAHPGDRQSTFDAVKSSATEGAALDLLVKGEFDALDRRYNAVQRDYREGRISDEQLIVPFRVFYATDPKLESSYIAWVGHSPNSYAAHLAKGIYHASVARERRGTKFISETSDQQLREMRTASTLAVKELKTSLRLDARPLLSYNRLIDTFFTGNNDSAREFLDRASKIDPHNVIVRAKYILTLQTRWGGSVEQMQSFLEECRAAGIAATHLATFESLLEEDRGWTYEFRDENLDEAVRHYRRAAELNPERDCVPCGPLNRALEILKKQNKYAEVIEIETQILAAHPKSIPALRDRGFSEFRLKQYDAAFADFSLAAEADDAYSVAMLGTMHAMGRGVARDQQKAMELLHRAKSLQAKEDAAQTQASPQTEP